MGRRRKTPKITGNDNVVGSNSGDIDFQGVLPKRKRTLQKDEVEQVSDRLSELPDSLLVEIQSYLPLEDAVRTGILSKRWKTLWTLVHRIRLRHECDGDEKLERFISFVDHILMQCARPNLKEFSLCMLEEMYAEDYFERVTPTIEKWLQYVSSKNVKFLKLDFDLYTFRFPRKLSWFSLEKLSLSHITIYNEQIADILLGCPLLDTLILENLTTLKLLNIASPKLRKLELLSFSAVNYNDTFLKINAPWLKELVISGDFCAFDCWLVDVSSLIFAKVTFAYNLLDLYNNDDDAVREILSLKLATGMLKKLQHVEELIVGPFLIQALSELKLLGKPSPLFKCKRLTVESLLRAWELPGVARLLQRLPHLETLVIQLQSVDEWEPAYFSETENVNGEKYLSMQKGSFQHLKNVRVVDGRRNFCLRDPYSNRGVGKSFEIEVVAYLLRNAYVLEKFVFTTPINNNCKCSIN